MTDQIHITLSAPQSRHFTTDPFAVGQVFLYGSKIFLALYRLENGLGHKLILTPERPGYGWDQETDGTVLFERSRVSSWRVAHQEWSARLDRKDAEPLAAVERTPVTNWAYYVLTLELKKQKSFY